MYALDTDMKGEGYDLKYRTGSRSWETFSDRQATSVTVDSKGNPWITNNKNEIWAWNDGDWKRVKGLASKIAIGADGSIFALDNKLIGDEGYGIWKYDDKNHKWHKVGSGAIDISVGDDGKPYIIRNKDKLMWPEKACPGNWSNSRGVQITVHFEEPKTWDDAHAFCQARGGNLASYRSQTELDKLTTYANNCMPDEFYWVGATDKEREGKWTWTDDKTTLDFAAWAEEEPNNDDPGQHCGGLYTEEGAMYDQVCDAELFFMCQRPLKDGEEAVEIPCREKVEPPKRVDVKIEHKDFCSDERKTGGNDLCGC